jgi:hypothetical protein
MRVDYRFPRSHINGAPPGTSPYRATTTAMASRTWRSIGRPVARGTSPRGARGGSDGFAGEPSLPRLAATRANQREVHRGCTDRRRTSATSTVGVQDITAVAPQAQLALLAVPGSNPGGPTISRCSSHCRSDWLVDGVPERRSGARASTGGYSKLPPDERSWAQAVERPSRTSVQTKCSKYVLGAAIYQHHVGSTRVRNEPHRRGFPLTPVID